MKELDVLDVLEQWVAERKLSRRQTSFLKTVHQQTMECMGGMYVPQIAGQGLSSDLDRPEAVYTCQLVADLLDYLKPLDGACKRHARLIEVTDALVECDHLAEEEAEALYNSL
jgi:hypothetical protein